MLLEELALLFSDKLEDWPMRSPSSALPFSLRNFIKSSYSKKHTSNDRHKKNIPHRFGVFSRPFQPGDPLKTISRTHLIRLNSLITKMDIAQSRKKILILFHSYNNMTYKSSFSKVNKGQVAQGIAAILEHVHKTIGQSISIHGFNGNDLFGEKEFSWINFKSYEKIYFLSDFLFNAHSYDACAEEMKKFIKYLNIKNCGFFIIRDPLEYEEKYINEITDYKLIPWQKEIKSNFDLYINYEYHKNIRNQIHKIKEIIDFSQNFCKVVTGNQSVFEIINFMKLQDQMYKII